MHVYMCIVLNPFKVVKSDAHLCVSCAKRLNTVEHIYAQCVRCLNTFETG